MTPLTLDTFLPYRLSYTSNLVSERIARSYRALFGLTIPEWRVVAVLGEVQGISQQDICTKTRMDKVTVSRAAIALRQRGLIADAPHPADGRARSLSLTAAGRELYDRIVPKALELERAIFGQLSAAQVQAFERTLRQIDMIVEGLERD
jgi:DNA-binding MarR family transcriptional regulator